MRALLFTLSALLLTACTVTPSRPPAERESAWKAHRQALAAVDQWRLNGRLGIQTEGKGWHASVYWRQDEADYDIRIVAPLGQGTVRLVGDDRQVRLTTSRGEEAASADPGQLLQQQLGWRVPVGALRYWALGLPAPGEAAKTLNEQGYLERLFQGGWHIRFEDYRLQAGLALPGRVIASHPEAEVRLVVSDWKPTATAVAGS